MIQIRELSFGFEKMPVLQDFCAELQDGQITALIGPNGAGKSTLLRLISRLEKPWTGTIDVNGLPVQTYAPKAFARVLSYLPQSRPLPSIPVRTLVMHGRFARLGPSRRPSAQDEAAVDAALQQTGLTALAHRALSTLSGGQRQKAYIAMAIAQEAQHLLLDEPLTHLDMSCQLELLDLLKRLRSEGRCIVMAVHDLPLLWDNCDRVIVLNKGRKAFDGNAHDLIESGVFEKAFGLRPVLREGVALERISPPSLD